MRYKKTTKGDGVFVAPVVDRSNGREGFQGWATPQGLVDLVGKMIGIGAFDLDVCALAHNAKAKLYITPDDDGLLVPWQCTSAWCNPPFRAADIERWAERAIEQLRMGHVRGPAAFLTVPKSDQGWWHYLMSSGLVMAQIDGRGRVAFLNEYGVPGTQQDSATTVLILGREQVVQQGQSLYTKRGWFAYDRHAMKWVGGWFGHETEFVVRCQKQLL